MHRSLQFESVPIIRKIRKGSVDVVCFQTLGSFEMPYNQVTMTNRVIGGIVVGRVSPSHPTFPDLSLYLENRDRGNGMINGLSEA